jgi:hypothetical protein
MQKHEWQQADWLDVLRRLEQGQSQRKVAELLGVSLGQLKYRLRRYRQAVSQDELSAGLTREEALGFSELWQDDYRELDLWNESWSRRLSGSRLSLWAVDPHHLFAYWTVADWRKQLVEEHFRQSWMDLPVCLRLNDVTDLWFDGYNAHESVQIRIHPNTDNWHFLQIVSDRNYVLELGISLDSGAFFSILRSNMVHCPADPLADAVHPTIEFRKILGDEQDCPDGLLVEQAPVSMRVPSKHAPSANPTALLGEPPYAPIFDGYSIRRVDSSVPEGETVNPVPSEGART